MDKKRIALMIPHTDITLEADLQGSLPPQYVLHTQRMWLGNVEKTAEKRMVDKEFPKALRYLTGITEFDAAVFGCTSASAVYGRSGLEGIETLMKETLGCRAVSAFGAVLHAIQKRKAQRIALVTPYIEAVNCFMEQSMSEFGVKVVCSVGMGILNDAGIVAVGPAEIGKFVYNHQDAIRTEAELCLISCTALRAMEVRVALEELLRMPVITSNQCIYDFITEG